MRGGAVFFRGDGRVVNLYMSLGSNTNSLPRKHQQCIIAFNCSVMQHISTSQASPMERGFYSVFQLSVKNTHTHTKNKRATERERESARDRDRKTKRQTKRDADNDDSAKHKRLTLLLTNKLSSVNELNAYFETN